LEIIQPEFICCLGASAARALLKTETSIGKLRGKFFPYEGAEALCTYHPSYLLRNPAAKRDVWEDMQLLMKRMGIELPS
ncbi:MAG: uracil-DNA glycosylase family protein, partial [Pirellulales bacterium]